MACAAGSSPFTKEGSRVFSGFWASQAPREAFPLLPETSTRIGGGLATERGTGSRITAVAAVSRLFSFWPSFRLSFCPTASSNTAAGGGFFSRESRSFRLFTSARICSMLKSERGSTESRESSSPLEVFLEPEPCSRRVQSFDSSPGSSQGENGLFCLFILLASSFYESLLSLLSLLDC